ncbi:hypothetical protein AB0P05_27265 [Streptomyces flaveolus]|uniref:hypothetical protein n=1 Tax=Streptomyces flaveolus TaxID=67297 RepID=UPI00342017B7
MRRHSKLLRIGKGGLDHRIEATGAYVGVEVESVYNAGTEWHLNWTDGPVKTEMDKHLADALAGHLFPDMRDRTIRRWRSTSTRAWAARAIASRRAGTLATAVAEGAALYRSLPMSRPPARCPAAS